MMDDDEDIDMLECPSCQSKEIFVETPAIHRSDSFDGIGLDDGVYRVWNSDNSWKIPNEDLSEFVCGTCNERWKPDKTILWEFRY